MRQWPAKHEIWQDAFFDINRAPIFRDAVARIFSGGKAKYEMENERQRKNREGAGKRTRDTNVFSNAKEEQKSVQQLLEIGVQPVEKLTRVVSMDWNVGDRIEAAKNISYNGGVVITKGSVGAIVKEHLDRAEYMGVIFDEMKGKLLGAQPHEIKKESLVGAICLAKRPEACRWPTLVQQFQGEDICPTMHEDDPSLRLRFRMGFTSGTVALEHTHKSNVYITLNNKKVQFGDYSDRELDKNCSFWIKRVSDYIFRLESCCTKQSYLAVTQPADPKAVRPAVVLMENNASSAFKEATAFMLRQNGKSTLCEQVYSVDAYHLGGHNIAVTWRPNVGKVRIWMQQKRRWLKVQDVGGHEKPCAWVFALDELDPVRVCVAPHTLRHFFADINNGEWARFGGNVSDWVEIYGEKSVTGSATPSSNVCTSTLGTYSKLLWTGRSGTKRTSTMSVSGRTSMTGNATPKSLTTRPSVSRTATPKALSRRSSPRDVRASEVFDRKPSLSDVRGSKVLDRRLSRSGSASPRSHANRPSLSSTNTPKKRERRLSQRASRNWMVDGENPTGIAATTPKERERRLPRSGSRTLKAHGEKLPELNTSIPKARERRP